MSSSVEKIKDRLTIMEVISGYLKIEKAGASYKAKCPFHNEKTPSFFISPDRGTYYCFGCGAKGDIFTFVEEFEGVEFKEALSMLALRAGIDLVPEKKEVRAQEKELADILEEAADFYVDRLKAQKEVITYLKKRGLSDDTIRSWRIGYAHLEWRDLYDHLQKAGVSATKMLAAGLIKKNEKAVGEPYYDTFRGRIMFPLFDRAGKVVGFSGRIIVEDEQAPKYLNSPETALFSKSEFLYGLDRAKMAIRKRDYSILVEGQFDLILSHQAGFENTVATSGTALTERHIRRLQSLSNRVMFAYDGDSAGFAATERSAELALSLGMEVKVVALPKGEDPASLILKDSKLWQAVVLKSVHIVDFYTDELLRNEKDSRVLGKKIKEKVLPFIIKLASTMERSHFVKRIAEKSGIKEEAIWDDLKDLAKNIRAIPSGSPLALSSSQGPKSIARTIMGVIYWQEGKKSPDIPPESIKKRLEEVMGVREAERSKEEAEMEREKLIFETEQYYEGSDRLKVEIEELFRRLEEERLKNELSTTILALKQAEKDNNPDLARKILEHCQEISTRLSMIKKNVEGGVKK